MMKLVVEGSGNTAKLYDDRGRDILPDLMVRNIKIEVGPDKRPSVVLYCFMDMDIDFEKHNLTVQDANANG